MATVYICLILAFGLIYLSKLPVGYAQSKMGGYDNHHPRDQQAGLTGWGKRALAAHHNTIETFPGFGVGVLLALYSEVDVNLLSGLCVGFVLARALFILLYIQDKSTMRSLIWGVGQCITLSLYLIPLIDILKE